MKFKIKNIKLTTFKSALLPAIFIIIAFFYSCKYDKIPNSPDSGYVTGKIYDALTGATLTNFVPVDNANIRTEPPSTTAISMQDGRYYLYNVPPGHYLVIAEKNGYNLNRGSIEVSSRKTITSNIILYRLIETNKAPEKPYNPIPQNGAKISDSSFTLYWRCSDPDTNMMFFDVYLSKFNPPTQLAAKNIPEIKSLFLFGLEWNTQYFWRVCAKDWFNSSAMSEVWTFTVTE